MNGLESNLVLTVPLVVIVVVFGFAWDRLMHWLGEELSDPEGAPGYEGSSGSLNSFATAGRPRRVERGAGDRERASEERLARIPLKLTKGTGSSE